MITILATQNEEKIKEIIEQFLRQEGFSVSKNAQAGMLYRSILTMTEKRLIEQILERTEGNQLKAARLLGINRNTIRSKIKKLCIDINKWKL